MTRLSQTFHPPASFFGLSAFSATACERLIRRCLAIFSDNALRRLWRAHRNRQALMALADWQRDDCGLGGRGIPSASDLEIAARRRMKTGLDFDWR